MVIPVIDIVGAVASVVVTSMGALALRAEDGPVSGSVLVLGVGLGLGTTYALSSSVGFGRARRCRRAFEAWTASNR